MRLRLASCRSLGHVEKTRLYRLHTSDLDSKRHGPRFDRFYNIKPHVVKTHLSFCMIEKVMKVCPFNIVLYQSSFLGTSSVAEETAVRDWFATRKHNGRLDSHLKHSVTYKDYRALSIPPSFSITPLLLTVAISRYATPTSRTNARRSVQVTVKLTLRYGHLTGAPPFM